jgi:hypothetical protein
MGRMWDALRRGGSTASDSEQLQVIPAPIEDEGPMLADAEEIPFIEVGPQKSMEASPSVLAYTSHVAAPSRALPSREKSAPPPRCVPFRTVFLAAPGTPQTDGAA